MYIGWKKQHNSEYFQGYRENLAEKTVSGMKVLMLFALPCIAFFLFQDFYLIQDPGLFTSWLFLLIPFLVYAPYLFFIRHKSWKLTEGLQALFCFSALLMSISRTSYILKSTEFTHYQFKLIFLFLALWFFLIYIFLKNARRWIHYILGAALVIFFLLVSKYEFTNIVDKLSFHFVYIAIYLLLLYQTAFNESHRFEEYILRMEKTERVNEVQKLYTKLENLSTRDPLTSTITRVVGLEMLGNEIERSNREKRPLTVVYINLDGLSDVNDSFGFAEGDTYLLAVINTLQGRLRTSDFITRMAGDEFLIVLPNCRSSDAIEIISHANRDPVGRGYNKITLFSFGVAGYAKSYHSSVNQLIKDVETKMYQDKRRKKGRS